MDDSSYADKINKWQITVENIEADLPKMPGSEAPFAELKELVGSLRGANEGVQTAVAALKIAVRSRQTLDRQARRAHRRLAAIARGHLGFDNPTLEAYGIKPENPNRVRRTKSTPSPREEVPSKPAA